MAGEQDACVLFPAATTDSRCDLAEVTAMSSLLGENQRWQSLHFPKAWESWNMGGLPAPHEPQPCLLLLLFMKKAFRFGFKALWGTQSKKQGVPATARRKATFICSVSPNTSQLTFQTNISPRGLHTGCGRGEGRYFLSSFKMRQSRPRVSFLNIFITGDPFDYFTTVQPPVLQALAKCSEFIG